MTQADRYAALERDLNQLSLHFMADIEMHAGPWGVEVSHLVVDGTSRGRSVGSGFVEDVIERAEVERAAGLAIPTLTVKTQGGRPAERMLEQLGFDEIRRDEYAEADEEFSAVGTIYFDRQE